MNIIALFCKKFLSCQRGNLGLAFGLSLIPIITGAGIAIDYSSATNARAKLDAYIDAAVLAAVSPQVINTGLGVEDQKKAGTKVAETEFNAQLGTSATLQGIVTKKSFTAGNDGGSVTIRACYEAEVKTAFMSMVQVKSIPFGRCAQSSAQAPLYVDVHLVIDASGSMGIGATAKDQELMYNQTGCSLACHTLNWGQSKFAPSCNTWDDWSRTPNCARKVGARLRFDVVKDAAITIIESAQKNTKMKDQFRFSAYKFSNYLTSVSGLSANLDAVKASISSMTMDVRGAGTNFTYSIKSLAGGLSTGGDGKNSSSAKTYVVILTDAVEDSVYESCSIPSMFPGACEFYGRADVDGKFVTQSKYLADGDKTIQNIDSSACKIIKEKNITIMMLNTKYIIPDKDYDHRFPGMRSDIIPNIESKVQECVSSPELSFHATTPGEITAAANQISKTLGNGASLRE